MSDSSEERGPQRLCGNCREHPAIVNVNGVLLCVDCYSRLQATEQQRIATALQVQDMLGRESNFIAGMIEQSVGLPGLVPRYQVREPPTTVQTGPVTQNLSIHDNAIGVLNTGTVQHLDATIGSIRNSGDAELADALKRFVETAVNDDALADEDKRELVEGIDLILQEASVPEPQQRRGLLRTVVARITQLAATVTTVAEGWQHLEPLLRRAFPPLF